LNILQPVFRLIVLVAITMHIAGFTNFHYDAVLSWLLLLIAADILNFIKELIQ